MSWFSRPEAWVPAVLLLSCAPAAARAQGSWSETQLWGVAVASRPALFGVGLGFNWRDRGRTRIGGGIAGGATDDGRAMVRIEGAWHFMLDPLRTHGVGVYGGGGLALSVIDRGGVHPYVLALIGAETTPGGRRGLFIEAGFGGGVRLAAGVRWRKQNAPNR